MVVVATTLTALAAGVAAGCGALESAEPQAESTRVAAATVTSKERLMLESYLK
jgi:hypothetical protein